MPPIRSTLDADFSDFIAETKKANAALGEMDDQGKRVAASFGQSAVVVGKFGDTADTVSRGTTSITSGLRQADKILAQFGVNVSSEINALEELGQIAGKTAGEVGLIGTAAASAGAFLLGMKLGEIANQVLGADKAFASLLITLGLFPNAAKEASAAQAEMIANAQRFDPSVRTVADALRVLTDNLGATGNAFNNSAAMVRGWNIELKGAKADGLEGLTREIKAGNMTQEEMAAKYQVSVRAIQFYTKELDKQKDAQKKAREEINKQTDAMVQVKAAADGYSQVLDTLTADEREQIETALSLGVAQNVVADAFGKSAVQVRAVDEAMKKNAETAKQIAAAQKIVSDANAAWNDEVIKRSGTTTQQLRADILKWETDTIASLDKTGRASEENYNAIHAIAQEKLAAIGVNWDTLRDGSIASLTDTAVRAEVTYQRMLAASGVYTTGAIANAKKVAEEAANNLRVQQAGLTQAQLDEISGYERVAAEQQKVAQQREEQANADVAFSRELNRQQDAVIAASQKYGITLDEAAAKLGLMGNTANVEIPKVTNETKKATAAANELTIAFQAASRSAEELAARAQQAYLDSSENFKRGDPFGVGFFQEQQRLSYQQQAGQRANYELQTAAAATSRGAWGGTMNLNVNVNSPQAGNIAQQIATEMRHAGVRFGY